MAPGSSGPTSAAGRAGARPARKTKPPAKRRRRGGRILRGIGWLVLAVLVFLGSTAAGLLAAPVNFTPPAPPRPALILDRNGKIIGEIASPEQRTEVPANQIPDVMRNAMVAAEDKSFYSNSGVDPLSIVRAAVNNISGDSTEGGSTITQQYVKNVFVGNERTYVRKLREAALAIRLNQRLTKTEILTRYLNEVYFGQGTYGVEAAAQYYFGVDSKDLTLAEAAMLAGIVRAPSDDNPVASLTNARVRQQYVLNRMVDSGYIDTATASSAYATVPTIVKKLAAASTASSLAPQFVGQVVSQVKQQYANQQDVLYRGGLAVRTTLDSSWQQAANAALGAVLPKASDPEASVVVVNSDTGDILAVADKVDADHPQLDTSYSSRKSGSSVKPFTLATALENGYSIDDSAYGPSAKTYPQSQCPSDTGSPYTITNDEGGGGSYTLTSALAESVNTVYGPLAIKLGTTKVAAVAHAAGLLPTVTAADTVCSMGLGVNTTPRDEAVAYSTLADGGVYHPARDLLSVNAGVDASGGGGTTIYTAPTPAGTQAVPASVAANVQTAMRAVVRYGTATAAQQPDGLDVYGKTGTTNDFVDAWFSGCVPAYHVCVATWMGYDSPGTDANPHTMKNVEGVYHVAGGTLPAKIFARTMDGYRTTANPVVTPSSSAPASTPTTRATTRRTRTPTAPVSTPASTPATRTQTVAPPATTATRVSTRPTPTVSRTAAAP